MASLDIRNLSISVEGKAVLRGFSLFVKDGEVHALMGPNGAGKSTLGKALLGHPNCKVEGGSARLDGKDLLKMKIEERAKAGLFLAFQHPAEVEGVTYSQLLQRARAGVPPAELRAKLGEETEKLGLARGFSDRQVGAGLSGGERKRAEVLQLLVLKPKFAILDEIDSGLDIDGLKKVARTVEEMRGSGFGAILITHYPRLLHFIKPDKVHVLANGRVARSGGSALVNEIEEKGYAGLSRGAA